MSGDDDETIIDRIYAAAAVPEIWEDVLRDVARASAAVAGGLFLRREDAWTGWRLCDCPDPSDYFETSAHRSVTTPRLLAMRRNGFVGDHEAFTEADYRADPMITDWAAPLGLFHGAATAIQTPHGDTAIFQFMRRDGEECFEPETIARLDRFRPHLARAAMLSSRWRLERLRTTVEALQAVGLPAAVVASTGRTPVANAAFEALSDHVTWLADGRFRFACQSATDLLREATARLGARAPAAARSFALHAADGGKPAVAHFVPVRGEAQDLFGGDMALLVVTPLGERGQVDLDVVQALFDLTPAEAQVAAALLAGRSVGEIAAAQAVSPETVRTQVKAVLAKSGAGRQAEFVARFGAASLRAPDPP